VKEHHLFAKGMGLTRDSLVSVMYPAGLNSAKSSVTLQRTDRHGILGEKPSDFPDSTGFCGWWDEGRTTNQ
jgi:hypothetical protein